MKQLLIIVILTCLGSCSVFEKYSDRTPIQKQGNLENDMIINTQKEPENVQRKKIREELEQTDKVSNYCDLVQSKFNLYNWGDSKCKTYKWNHVRNSVLGRPLIWSVYGNEKEHKLNKKNMTMVMCGVHGDEITPIKFCFDLMEELETNPNIYKDKLVVVAPIVCPDCFFKTKPTRTNARGVDLNRNFPTKDWYSKAIKYWKHRYSSAKRRYPGKRPLSEPGTLFQVNLILRYKPNKIVSVHSPLTMLDYDGPSIKREYHKHKHLPLSPKSRNAKKLLMDMSEKAKNYKVSDYPFFPGSLGNWAGNEKKIPTYTLELPNTDWTKTDKYWNQFKDSVLHAIEWDVEAKHIVQNSVKN